MPGAFAEATAKVRAANRRAEWLNLKRGKFGASSAWKFWTPKLSEADNETVRNYLKLKAAECDGLIPPEIRGAAIYHGNNEEEPGALDFMEHSGIKMHNFGDDQEWIGWDKSEQVGCTPDALILGDAVDPETGQLHKDAKLVFEQKNHETIEAYEKLASMQNGSELKDFDYKYWIQTQHQMMVVGSPFAVFQTRYSRTNSGKAELVAFIVPREESFIEQHGQRLLRAIEQRDALRQSRTCRTQIKLTDYIIQK